MEKRKKVMLIFGGSEGIGLATAKKFLSEGYSVYNASRKPCPVSGIKSIPCDTTRKNEIKTAVEETVKEASSVDIAIYCAGYGMAAPLEYADEADYRYLFEVNYFGAVSAVKELIPVMKSGGGGKIIFIGSIGGIIPIAYNSFYSSSKAALNMLCTSLYLELSQYNILLTCVMPGGTRTAFSLKRKIYHLEPAQGYSSLPSAVSALYKLEQEGDTPESVAKTVFKTVKSKNILVASGKNKLHHIASRITPHRLIVYLCKKKYLKN